MIYSEPWRIYFLSYVENLFKYLRWWVSLRTLAYSEQLIQIFSGIFRDIQQYSGILRDIKTYRGIFRHCGYWSIFSSVIFRILRNPHICNRTIFRTLAHLEPTASSKVCGTSKMIRYIQNPGMIRAVFSSIFKDI